MPNCSEPLLTDLARDFAGELKAGDRVVLEGPMGAGKTTFARALLQGLGVRQPPEGSPSFAIAHEYDSPKGEIVHIDFYRIKHESEIEDAGIPAYFWERNAIVISEWLSSWADFEQSILRATKAPSKVWKVEISFHPELPESRSVRIARTPEAGG